MLIGIKECARQLNISYQTMRKLGLNGKVPSIRIGNRLKFDIPKVIQALEQTEQRVVSAPHVKATVRRSNFLAGLNELKRKATQC